MTANSPICHHDRRCPTNSALVALPTLTCNYLHSVFRSATLRAKMICSSYFCLWTPRSEASSVPTQAMLKFQLWRPSRNTFVQLFSQSWRNVMWLPTIHGVIMEKVYTLFNSRNHCSIVSCIWETLHSVQFHNLQGWGQIYHTTIHTAHHTQSCHSCNIKNEEFKVTSDDPRFTVALLQLHYQLQSTEVSTPFCINCSVDSICSTSYLCTSKPRL